MTAAGILKNKSGEIFSIKETDTLAGAAKVLSEKNIGAVIVVDASGAPSGVLSERDIVRALVAEGPDALTALVSAKMSNPIISCSPADTVDRLLALMTERRIRHLPVMEDGRLKGVISIGDVVKRRIQETEQEAQALKDYITH